MLSERQCTILKALIEEFIGNGMPIGSDYLVEKFDFPFSPATMRIEMNRLTDQGFITQPHPSAGRVPTSQGYQFFVEEFMESWKLPASTVEVLEKEWQDILLSQPWRSATILARFSKMVSIVGFGDPPFVHQEGLEFLVDAPEFRTAQDFCSIFETIDLVRSQAQELFDQVWKQGGLGVFIGDEYPFLAGKVSLVVGALNEPQSIPSFIGVLGPMRMSYQRTIPLVSYISNLARKEKRLAKIYE